ncbi:MAG: hypothetical protein OHK0029_14490 [Armatimonadaceae bacterium]
MPSIQLSEDTSQKLHRMAERRGLSVDRLLEDFLSLEELDRASEIQAVEKGLDDLKKGKVRPLQEFFAEHRARFPETPSEQKSHG